ncbi:addiction module protein [Humisphaera borealis]|uniref:Addiction module protein n=1 Tax=Humisphaera borealis TaxID=2807512 RepID=A0A7M2X3I1_9BACT|nr:addiction module protein [Humisphaera borealis]QOV92235.1 addiction module protein [Humisphaera borealis]
MTAQMQSVREAALSLSRDERARLAEELMLSLDDPILADAEQAEVDAAWAHEIRRRIAAHRSGQTTPIPAQEVFAKLRARRA